MRFYGLVTIVSRYRLCRSRIGVVVAAAGLLCRFGGGLFFRFLLLAEFTDDCAPEFVELFVWIPAFAFGCGDNGCGCKDGYRDCGGGGRLDFGFGRGGRWGGSFSQFLLDVRLDNGKGIPTVSSIPQLEENGRLLGRLRIGEFVFFETGTTIGGQRLRERFFALGGYVSGKNPRGNLSLSSHFPWKHRTEPFLTFLHCPLWTFRIARMIAATWFRRLCLTFLITGRIVTFWRGGRWRRRSRGSIFVAPWERTWRWRYPFWFVGVVGFVPGGCVG